MRGVCSGKFKALALFLFLFLERMMCLKFSRLGVSSINEKEIGAFYGVNRTNKINDYQLSDCKNFDCENFPYFSTRKGRELFYSDNKMAAICHDTDVTDDYKVTGVTDDGAFVYRGEKLINDGCKCDSIAEFLGDYILLPQKKYVRADTSLVGGESKYSAELKDFLKPADDIECAYSTVMANSSNLQYYQSLGAYLSVGSKIVRFKYSYDYRSFDLVKNICSGYFNIYPGMFFKLKLAARNGRPEYSSGENGEQIPLYDEHICDIPDYVYMVVDDMYIKKSDGTIYRYGEDGFSYAMLIGVSSGQINEAYIEFTARREDTGELYDISRHFKYYASSDKTNEELAQDGTFRAGVAYYSMGYSPYTYRWNDVYILPEAPVMLFGAHFGGRFFACDNLGVDVLYSSSAEKFDFTPGTSTSDAGALSCVDAGKWTAMCVYGGCLYVFKKNGMYRIYSNDGLNFYMDKISDVGAVSKNAVCVVSDVMYFLSETGLYRFTGTYPEELPENLGRKYTDGVLGGYDNKLYASLSHSGGCELIVYDAVVSAYGVHDNFKVKNFVTYGGVLYALSDDGYVYKMAGEQESLEFSLSTRKFFLSFEKKAINGIRLYFDFSGGENEKMIVSVSYDGGEFEPCLHPITSGKLKYVPIKFKKCDELCVKISGYGVFTLKGMSLSLYSGGDIKQNK